jgi:TolB-like protein/Tfp pilus assembly protein PilF
MVGRRLSHYRIIGQLGAGGMGIVFRARDERLDRDVALKLLPSGALADETSRRRLRREAQALSRLNHPHIATIHDYDSDDGTDFLVMELVEGETLAQRLTRGPLAENEAVRLGVRIADALEFAHARGVIHRDLKPGNIMVTPRGDPKVLDFGLAKALGPKAEGMTGASLTGQPSAAGTPPYIAPEVLLGADVDARVDVYALGAVLYEMTTGQRAFPQENMAALMYAILNEPPPPLASLNPDLSTGLVAIIEKAMARQPEERHATAAALLVDLRAQPAAAGLAAVERRPPGRHARVSRRVFVVSVGVVVTAMILGAGLAWRRFAPSAPRIRSLAVLPLSNLSGDRDQEYFADGMTDELIANLARIGRLRVISRASSMHYKDTRLTLPQIARELRVQAIITGSVRRFGDRVRITAELIHAPDERHLWVESYERDARDVLTLQSEIARTIAREVRVTLTPGEEARFAQARPIVPDSYDDYLRGRFQLNRRTQEGLQRATEYFEKAIVSNSSDARAYAGLADAHMLIISFGDLPPRELDSRADWAVAKALELDQDLPEVQTTVGIYRRLNWDWEGAERALRRAIALRPSYADAHIFYATVLTALGQVDRGIAEARRAEELDPLAPINSAVLGVMYYDAHQYDRAIAQCRHALEIAPEFPTASQFIGWCFEQKCMYPEAIAAFKKAYRDSRGEPRYLADLGHAYGLAGRRAEALGVLEELNRQFRNSLVRPYLLGIVHLGLGDRDRAFEWLNRACQEGSGGLNYINVQARFDSIRDDPRFGDLLRCVGLTATVQRTWPRQESGRPVSSHLRM